MSLTPSKIAHSPIRSFGKDALKYVPAQIAPALISFFAVAAYTRLLTPEQYGHYILVITTVAIVSSVGFGWINQSGIRYFEEHRKLNRLPRFLSTSLISILGLLLIIVPLWYCTTIIFKKTWDIDFVQLMRLGGILLITQTGCSFVLILARAGRRVFKYGLYVLLNSLGAFLIAIALIKFMNLGSNAILMGMIISSGGVYLLELSGFCKDHFIKLTNYSFNTLREFASYGIPMIGVSAGSLVISVCDRYVIRLFIDAEAVGIYSATYSLGHKAVVAIADILMLAAFPVILHTFVRKGKEKTSTLIENLLGIYLLALVPIVFGGIVLSEDLVGTILGQSFRGCHTILPWVMGGVFCERLSLYCGASLKLMKKTSYLLLIWGFGGIANIVLNIFLIPLFNIFGAAYATLASYAVCLAVIWVVGHKLLPFAFPWQSFWKGMLAASVMALILKAGLSGMSIKGINIISKIALGASIYFVLLAILREKLFLQTLRVFLGRLKNLRSW